MIGQTADVIRAQDQDQHGSQGDFIGHIAGDDFVFITSSDCVDAVCLAICERFDHVIKYFYKRTDRERGFIEAKDRFGTQRRFPIMSVSIAAISISKAKTTRHWPSSPQGKRLAKAIPGLELRAGWPGDPAARARRVPVDRDRAPASALVTRSGGACLRRSRP